MTGYAAMIKALLLAAYLLPWLEVAPRAEPIAECRRVCLVESSFFECEVCYGLALSGGRCHGPVVDWPIERVRRGCIPVGADGIGDPGTLRVDFAYRPAGDAREWHETVWTMEWTSPFRPVLTSGFIFADDFESGDVGRWPAARRGVP